MAECKIHVAEFKIVGVLNDQMRLPHQNVPFLATKLIQNLCADQLLSDCVEFSGVNSNSQGGVQGIGKALISIYSLRPLTDTEWNNVQAKILDIADSSNTKIAF